MLELAFLLIVGHALADFVLQTDVMAKWKNRHNAPTEIPDYQKYVPCWPYWLTSHALVHGGAVYLITGSLFLGTVETVLHWGIDFIKREGWTDPNEDQALHFVCKVGYLSWVGI